MLNSAPGRRSVRAVVVAATSAVTLLLASCGGSDNAAGPEGSTEKPIGSVYTVGYMPYAGEADGKLTGVEGDLLTAAAGELKRPVQTVGVEFGAMLAGIQANRYDVGIGGIAWTAERAKTGSMTDPIYYSPTVVMCRSGLSVNNVAGLNGLTVGTLTGTIQDKGVRAAPGATSRTYPTAQAMTEDLAAGRVDCVSMDTLTVAYLQKKRPDLNSFVISVLATPTDQEIAANPDLAQLKPYMVVWYCAKNQAELCDRLNPVIDGWYSSGEIARTLKQWGIEDTDSYLIPPADAATLRRGVDRPTEWNPPSIKAQ